MEIEKYAMYLRKSRQDIEGEKLGDEETLARHHRILNELAVRRGLYIEKVYSEVVSGETIAARPQMQQLIQDCYDGKYRGIIIIEVTRLSRGNQGDAQIILDCLKYGNRNKRILVITPTKIYDIANNPDDSEYMEFELFMSRREYKMIQKRMERGRRQAVVEGNYMGSYRPYGYDILKTRRGRTLQPNPEEAPVVKQIFAWTTEEGLTPGKIAKRLTSMAVPTYSGEPEWNIATIKTILTNPTYTGKVRWNDRMVVKTMVNGELRSSRPRQNHTEHYMLYDGKHEALIDEETFQQVAKRFVSDKTKANLKLKNPLAGLLICAKCKKAFVFSSYCEKKNTKSRLVHPVSQLCKVKSAAYDDVINALVHALKTYLEDFELKVDNLPTVDENSILGQIEALQKEIKKTEKRLSRLFEAWEDGTIDNNEFLERKEVNKEKLSNLEKQIGELERSIPEKEAYQERIMCLSDALNALLDPNIDADVKNEYLKAVIDQIEYSRENDREFILDVYLK